jgi:hypothetical protein
MEEAMRIIANINLGQTISVLWQIAPEIHATKGIFMLQNKTRWPLTPAPTTSL